MSQATSKTQVGREGQLFDLSDFEGKGRTASVTPIAFGRAVYQDPNYDNGAVLPDVANVTTKGAVDPATASFIGITIYEHQNPVRNAAHMPVAVLPIPYGHVNTKEDYVGQTETVDVAVTGRIYAMSESDVKPGDKVFVRHTIDAGVPSKSNLGTFRGDADGGKAIELKGAKWDNHSTSAGKVGVIDLGRTTGH